MRKLTNPISADNQTASKTLAQQLRWQVIWAAIAFSIAVIASIFYINWRSLEFAANEMFILDAKNILQDYLERKGFSSIEEFRGIASSRVVEQSAVRRKSEEYNGGYTTPELAVEE